MANGDKKLVPASPGPYVALPSVEDDAAMKRAMKGATTSRSTAMARRTAEKQMKSHPRLDR